MALLRTYRSVNKHGRKNGYPFKWQSHVSPKKSRSYSPPPTKVLHVEVETCACLDLGSDNCCRYLTQVCDWYDHDMLDCYTAKAFCDKNEDAAKKVEKLFAGKLEECSKACVFNLSHGLALCVPHV